jgi:hypothetical protein
VLVATKLSKERATLMAHGGKYDKKTKNTIKKYKNKNNELSVGL